MNCLYCEKDMSHLSKTTGHKLVRKFCNRSCAATYNNTKFPKKLAKISKCESCNVEVKGTRKKCSACSSVEFRRTKFISDWLAGNIRGGSDRKLSNRIRSYLLFNAGFACQKCGYDTCHPDDGKSILEINHIDGDGTNHSPDNLEVICPNCHALTSSYRGRNAGKGRPVYYTRVSFH